MNLVLRELADGAALGVESASPFCLKIHRSLRAAGLPYTRHHAPMPAAQKGPTGQVPLLDVDGRTLADSSTILRWIVATRPDRVAAGPEHWLWEELADTALNGFLVAARWADEDNWPRVRDLYFGGMPVFLRWFLPERIRAGVLRTLRARDVTRAGPEALRARFLTLLDDLDARAPRAGFWLGPAVGVADLALFGQLRSLDTPLTPGQAADLRARPQLSAWLDRVDTATRA